jgi:hypothetical protein
VRQSPNDPVEQRPSAVVTMQRHTSR